MKPQHLQHHCNMPKEHQFAAKRSSSTSGPRDSVHKPICGDPASRTPPADQTCRKISQLSSRNTVMANGKPPPQPSNRLLSSDGFAQIETHDQSRTILKQKPGVVLSAVQSKPIPPSTIARSGRNSPRRPPTVSRSPQRFSRTTTKFPDRDHQP